MEWRKNSTAQKESRGCLLWKENDPKRNNLRKAQYMWNCFISNNLMITNYKDRTVVSSPKFFHMEDAEFDKIIQEINVKAHNG